MRPVLCVGAVVIRDGRLLVIQRGQPPHAGRWSFPSGRLEPNELLADGALRELQEETGLTGTVDGLCGIAERFAPGGHIVVHDYWITVDPTSEPVAGDDAAHARFVTRAELDALPQVPRFTEFLHAHGVLDRMR